MPTLRMRSVPPPTHSVTTLHIRCSFVLTLLNCIQSQVPSPPVRGRWGWGGDLIPYHFLHVGQARDVKSPIFSDQETIYIAHEAKKENCMWKLRPIKSPTPGRKECINYPTLPHLLPRTGGWGLTLIAALYAASPWKRQSACFCLSYDERCSVIKFLS